MIHNSPSHIYHSALPLSPSSSWLYKCHSVEPLCGVKVVKGIPAEWGKCSCTVLFDNPIWALSYWNNIVAAGSKDIIILDAITGRQMAVLSGHTGWVKSVAFSPDGRSLVSGSNDRSVKLWDIQTGGVIKTFNGHTDYVLSASISVDCSRIVSGSEDGAICLWNIQTEKCLYTTKQWTRARQVSFSPINPQHIISISGNKVLQWDANGHMIPPMYDNDPSTLTTTNMMFAFSPDHTHLAVCEHGCVTVKKFDSGEIVAKLYVANSHTAAHCCFSPDGRFVAATGYNTAYVWNIASPNPYLLETFVNNNGFFALIFPSPSSLISAYKSVEFWKIGNLPIDKAITNPQSTLHSSPPIEFVSLQARAGIAISGDAYGAVKIWDLLTGLCKASFVAPHSSNQHRSLWDAKLTDGRLISICKYYDSVYHKIEIHDIRTGEQLTTLESPGHSDIRISGDGSKFFFLGSGYIEARSTQTGELMGKAELELDGRKYLDPLCIDNSKVWICSISASAQEGWDFGTSGSSPVPFDPSTGRPYLDFIGSASWQADSLCWIKDTATGKNIFQLSGRYANPKHVQWDGQYLVTGYESGEVLILDFHDMCPQ